MKLSGYLIIAGLIIILILIAIFQPTAAPERFIQERCFMGAYMVCAREGVLVSSEMKTISIAITNFQDEIVYIQEQAGSIIIDGEENRCDQVWWEGPSSLSRKTNGTLWFGECNGLQSGDLIDMEFYLHDTTESHIGQATMRVDSDSYRAKEKITPIIQTIIAIIIIICIFIAARFFGDWLAKKGKKK